MRSLLAVAAREVGERRMLLGLGLVGALCPLAYPSFGVPREGWRVLSVICAFSLTVAAALLTGGSVIGRDLAERRLGFFFARPLSSASLWGGKMLAALVLTAATLALSSLPLAWLGGPDLSGDRGAGAAATTTAGALGLVVLIALAHAASVGYRSRSPWFAADLVLAAAATGWTFHLVRTLLAHGLIPPVLTLLALAAAALTLAGAAQLAIGRTDARRGHAALSLVLWAVLFTGLTALQARAHWLVHPRWSDLVSADLVESAPRGDWIGVVGPARARGRARWAFLANVATGRSTPIGSARGNFAFAANGRRAAWVSSVQGDLDNATVSVLDLDAADLQPRTRTLPWRADRPIPIALSPDGSRLLALERGAAVVVDLDGPRPPLRVPVSAGFSGRQAAFVDPGHVRLFDNDQTKAFTGHLRLLDLDVRTGSVTEAGRIATRGNSWVRLSPDGARLLVFDRPDRQPSLALYTATGSHLATLTDAGGATQISADFLADGRIVVAQKDPAVRLRLLSPDGAEERAVELADRWSGVRLGGEAAAGQYLVGLTSAKGTERQTVVVDLASGRVVRREGGLLPSTWIWFFVRDAALRPAPGSVATRLFLGEGDELVHVDPGTGERRSLLKH